MLRPKVGMVVKVKSNPNIPYGYRNKIGEIDNISGPRPYPILVIIDGMPAVFESSELQVNRKQVL
jgi:hypothetical protein